jgi:hypothetical protein
VELVTQPTYALTPNEVKIVERDDDDLGYLWFADRQNGDIRYVTLTRSYQDDSVHTERDDQKWQAYGGLTAVEFDGNTLAMHFDKSAAAALGGVETVRVDCRAATAEVRTRLQEALMPLLAGTNVPLLIGRA